MLMRRVIIVVMSKTRAMFVFADESGDADCPGMKPYFAFSAVAFADEASRDKFEAVVKIFRQDNKLRPDLKFCKLSERLLTQFFIAVRNLRFRHSACIFRKVELTGQWKSKRYVHERVIREVVNGLALYFREVESENEKPLKVFVVHDEHTDPRYIKTIEDEFKKPRAKSGYPFVKDVKSGKS